MNKALLGAVNLSSGTLAILTGYRDYEVLDWFHQKFVEFVSENDFENWQEAWKAFEMSRV